MLLTTEVPIRNRGRTASGCPRRHPSQRDRATITFLSDCGVTRPGTESGMTAPATPRVPASAASGSHLAGQGPKVHHEHARKPIRGTVTILLVEDERALREIVKRQLTRHGYQVISASDGMEALEAAAGRDIDLVITDVLMPKMTGNELAAELQDISPNARVIFMSGYTRSLLDPGDTTSLLQKPFTESDLLDHIHEALGTDDDPDAAQEGSRPC
ncbi:MAG TPA: response regulator [Acidimicrobiales bacterium]|nr:response regulator [Acidimicrobiales bacterium]